MAPADSGSLFVEPETGLMARCVLVLGIGCSGTSATAGALHKLGCPMGRAGHLTHRPNGMGYYEDKCFYGQFTHAEDDAATRTRFRLLFKKHRTEPLWGWKNTLTYKVLPWMLGAIEEWGDEPYCVAVHRTFYASVRGRGQGKCGKYAGTFAHDIDGEFSRAASEAWAAEAMGDYWRALGGIRDRGTPLHHLSFEYLVAEPELEVERIVQFAFEGMERPDPETIRSAVEHIQIGEVHN